MSRRARSDRGATLVEFALVLPLLVLFVFGIVQFGIAYDTQQSINSAAREGARMAALPTTTVSVIRDTTKSSFVGVVDDTHVDVVVTHVTHAGTSTVVIADDATPCESPGRVVVEATTRRDISTPFFDAGTVDLTGRGEFRCEV